MRYHAFHISMIASFLALAVTLAGCSGGSSSTTVIRNTAQSVGAPASFIAVSGSNSVTLSWSPVSGVDSYWIYRSTSSPVTKATGSLLVSGIAPATLVYSDTTVTINSTYYYIMTTMKDAVESAESPEVSATPGSPAGTIQGTILYEDKEYGLGSFTGVTKWKPVRYAAVDVVSVANGAVLSTGQTDSRGKYTITASPGPTQVKVSVKSTAAPAASGMISAKNLSNSLYGVPSDVFTLSASAGVSIGISTSNGVGGAFNILDVMTTGYEFVKFHDGAYPAVPLDVYWPWASYPLGTYFCHGGCPAGDGIYVLNINGDTDQYDDDVLWHEFGHFLAFTYSVDQSEGGDHSLADIDHDLRFSWSEGWGDFLPGAIKAWLASTDPARLSTVAGLSPTVYVDTPTFSFDFGSATMPAQYSYASGETAVAKVLHGVRTAFSMADIWSIFRSFKDTPAMTPSNLELFFDRLIASYPTSSASARTIFAERQILYQIDGSEDDDVPATAFVIAIPSTQANRTLYSDADWDYVKFTPAVNTHYTIRTSSIRNGADTYLELYDNFGTLIAGNDNTSGLTYSTPPPFNCGSGICRENGSDILGSTIQFTSSADTPTGSYFIKVFSSPGKPASAGRYGTYNLVVTSP